MNINQENTAKQENNLIKNDFFNNNVMDEFDKMGCTKTTLFIFHSIITAIAIILSFRCNNKEFNLVSFMVALFFPYIYIIYVLSTKNLQQSCDI